MRTTVIVVVDDIDGIGDAFPHEFEIDGVRYEIDLNDSNYERLCAAIAPYIAAGRRIGGKSTRHPQALRTGGAKVPAPRRPETYTRIAVPPSAATVRAWWAANANGDLPEHSAYGRIPDKVMAAYNTRHKLRTVPAVPFRAPDVKETA